MIGFVIIALVAALMAADTINPEFVPNNGMTFAERATYNSAPWGAECVFDENGQPTNATGLVGCKDYRWQNHHKHAPRGGFNTLTADGFYLTPAYPGANPIDIPDDMNVVWYPQVSQVEVVCFDLQREFNGHGEYSTSCYDARLKMAHVTHGDWAVLEHEIQHHAVGAFHD